MSKDEPTSGELKIMLDDQLKRSEERHLEYKERDIRFMDILHNIETKIDSIKEQTTKTNGRVNKHDWQFKLIWWATGALWTVLLIGVPLLYKLYSYSLEQTLKDFKIDNKEAFNQIIDERIELQNGKH